MNTWLTIVLPMWIVALGAFLAQWLLMRRHTRKWKNSPEVVAAGRRLYDDGEFMRDIVKRTPARLFADKVELSCGHKTEDSSSGATRMNCYQCAEEWIEKQSALEKKR